MEDEDILDDFDQGNNLPNSGTVHRPLHQKWRTLHINNLAPKRLLEL